MNMKKTLAGIFAGTMALAALAVPASAAQEAKTLTINLQTTVCAAEADVEAEIWGKDISNIFSEGTYAFNFNVNSLLPKGDKNADWFNPYGGKYSYVSNIDGKSASLIVEGKDADGETVTKKVALKINEDGYYEFDVLAEGEVASKKEIAADTFDTITSIVFDGEVSYYTPDGSGYILLPSNASMEIVGINWDNGYIADFNKFINSDKFDTKGVKTETIEGVHLDASNSNSKDFLEAVINEDGLYFLDGFLANTTMAIADTIGMSKGATVSFIFITNESSTGLQWFNHWGADVGSILDVSYASLKNFAMGINLGATRLLQAKGEVKDNTVTFNWDELMAASNLAPGSVRTIAVRTNTDLVLGSIVVDVPAIEDASENELGAGNEQTDETVAPAEEVTTVATQAAGNAPTGNAPIALAAIPVALAAAVLVAKKRA